MVHYTTSCNTQSSALEDRQNKCPKHVGLTGIINKPLLVHLVSCLRIIYINDARSSKYQIYLWTLHISDLSRSIIRRNNCIYVTLGICYSVLLAVLYAGFHPAYTKNKYCTNLVSFTVLLKIILMHKKFIYRVKAVYMYGLCLGCFKFCLVFLEVCHIRWQTAENLYAST